MASHVLIEAHLAQLARRLPADAMPELADGLIETYRHYLHNGLISDLAASAAIAEFGTSEQISTAFTHHAPGRRAARLLLATGPAVGACWGASLVAGRIWTWHLPLAAGIAFGTTLLAVVAILAFAATSRASYQRTRLTALGATAMIVLDLALPATVALAAPIIIWPMTVAIAVSLIRAGLTLRALRRITAASISLR